MTKTSKLLQAVVRQLISLALVSTIVVPMFMIVVNSLKTKREANAMALSLPGTWEWANYATVIEKGKLVISFFNSCIYSFGSAAGVVLVTSLATFVLARRMSKATHFLYMFMILGIFLPVNYVALIKITTLLGIYGTRFGIICYYLGANVPFAVFVSFGYYNNIPRELDEAAFIDGATFLRTFISIIFPLLKPITVTVFILVFMGIWSDFTTPLYLINQTRMWPMNLAIYNFFGKYDSNWNLVFADIVMTILPVLVVYIVCQNQIVAGLTSGSVKG